jgi:pimeloyl-ACP methyl ester carboxylesterase
MSASQIIPVHAGELVLAMLDFFRAHQAVETRVPTYFIESTAPDNVDDLTPAVPPLLPELKDIDSDQAIQDIAKILASEPDPNLVVMVHGFNNPEPDVLQTYAAASRAIESDAAIFRRQGLVCVGYRWPSENMGQPRHGSWDALPTLPTWLLYVGAASVALCVLLFAAARWQPLASLVIHVVTMAGWTITGLVLTMVLLRFIVYFRDNYRAANYGVPDLIEIIRTLDNQIDELGGPRGAPPGQERVQLSFIGHSMGGFVVTNTIRALSDLFATPVTSLARGVAPTAAESGGDSPIGDIGRHFRLKRFVLASPDIPAETLLSDRANFLRSALRRFEEAYLFSNQGDEVLRQISTLANYFVFPTNQRDHGFRLGNLEILSSNFGLIDVAEPDCLSALRVGRLTLQELEDKLTTARVARLGVPPSGPSSPAEIPLPTIFTYFDCTDYVDVGRDGAAPRPLLTFAKCEKHDDPTARLRWFSHLRLLYAYLVHQTPNVHGGYFEGVLSQQLIYRLACLGFDETVKAFGGEGAMSAVCADKKIRVLVSPQLLSRRREQPVPNVTASARQVVRQSRC